MTYEELQEILKLRQRTPQGPAPTVDQIITAIQSQYQPVAAMPLPEASQGAQRFVTNAGSIGPIEQIVEYGRNPVTQSEMTTFVPGVFDINRTSYIPTPSAAQIEARLSGNTGSSDSGVVPLSPSQVAFFDFLDSPEGKSFKDARGAAMSNVIGASLGLFGPGLIAPAASLYNYMTGKPGIGKSISGLIDADKAAAQAARDALTNYGVTSTARGPTTAAQAQALANQLANELSYALASDAGYGTTGPGSASGIGVGSTQGINSMDAMSDSVSSPSGGYSTASGIGVGSTQGINAMDAMSDAASSSSPSSSKIVCTAMNESYGFGSFRNKIWLKYAADNLTKAHEVGYHTLFLPLVDLAYKKDVKPVRIVLENIARHRSADLRAEMRGTKRDNVGRVYRAILEPICYFVGKLKGY